MIIDLSGEVREGLWSYGAAYPEYRPRPSSAAEGRFFFEAFDGFHSQTGTYLETTAHVNGYAGNRLVSDIPAAALVDVPACVFRLAPGKRLYQPEDFEAAAAGRPAAPGSALLFSCGWEDWYAPDFISGSPRISLAAMEWLLAKEPFLIGSDTPCWEGPEPVFDRFAQTDVLLLAPLVNLRETEAFHARLTVLPVRLAGSCCIPARAVLRVEPS